MLECKADWIDGERFVAATSRNHAIVVDSSGQSNTASGPMDLVLIGLCACTASDLVNILSKKREPFTALQVRAEAERAADPPRVFTSIKLTYKVRGKVTRKALEDAIRLSKDKYCSVSAMLQSTAKITTAIEQEE